MDSARVSAGRVRPGLWLCAAAATLALALWHWSDGPSPTAADYAQYIAHARALADGRPYTDTGYIFTPLYPWAGPVAQPPGLPVVLWAVSLVFGTSEVAIKVAMLAFACGFYLLAGLYFARHDDVKLGLAVCFLVGLSREVAQSAAVVQSDLLFCFLIWVVITLYDRDGPFTAGRVAGVTLVGAFAVATRTFGVALVPAALVFTALNWRRHGIRPAIPLAVWAAGFLVATTVLPVTSGFPDVRALLSGLVPTVVDHVVAYRYAVFGVHHYPLPWDTGNDVYHALAGLVMLLGLAGWARHGFRRFSVVFGAVYVALLLSVPVLASRYLWVVYPLLAFGLVRGIAVLVARLGAVREAPARMTTSLGAAVLIAGLSVLWSERSLVPETTLIARPEVRDLFLEIEARAGGQPMRVAFFRPQVLALEAGVPAMTTFDRSQDTIVDELNRRCITHVVLGDLGLSPGADAAFREVVRSHVESFRLEYRNTGFELYRFVDLDCRRGNEDSWRPRS